MHDVFSISAWGELILFSLFFLAVNGLRCSSGFSLVPVCGLLAAMASVVTEHALSGARASRCGGLCRHGAWTVKGAGFNSCGRRAPCCGSQALERSLKSCGAQAWLLRGMWDLPRSGMEPVSPALVGGFFTTESPGKLGSEHL